ncbi:unnamed protein product [Cuscuta campestris]|uniref:HMG box domain-containing protein n=1 Tax=Cuscuta campestris TaxID=132261 RepID=A0A484MXH3_9ASTE|nr:unnamed protein product [Cuscuta campestris]
MKGAESKAKPDNKLAVRKSEAAEKKKAKKASKDPNKPKRPQTAFFIFMEEFRKRFNANNPNNKSLAAVGKAGGLEWKEMSDIEKASYKAESDKRKSAYEKAMEAYNRKQADAAPGQEEEESDKSRSEVNDPEDDHSRISKDWSDKENDDF